MEQDTETGASVTMISVPVPTPTVSQFFEAIQASVYAPDLPVLSFDEPLTNRQSNPDCDVEVTGLGSASSAPAQASSSINSNVNSVNANMFSDCYLMFNGVLYEQYQQVRQQQLEPSSFSALMHWQKPKSLLETHNDRSLVMTSQLSYDSSKSKEEEYDWNLNMMGWLMPAMKREVHVLIYDFGGRAVAVQSIDSFTNSFFDPEKPYYQHVFSWPFAAEDRAMKDPIAMTYMDGWSVKDLEPFVNAYIIRDYFEGQGYVDVNKQWHSIREM
jgi:hypothetical protein